MLSRHMLPNPIECLEIRDRQEEMTTLWWWTNSDTTRTHSMQHIQMKPRSKRTMCRAQCKPITQDWRGRVRSEPLSTDSGVHSGNGMWLATRRVPLRAGVPPSNYYYRIASRWCTVPCITCRCGLSLACVCLTRPAIKPIGVSNDLMIQQVIS